MASIGPDSFLLNTPEIERQLEIIEEQRQQRMQLRHQEYERERTAIIERIKMKSHRKPDG